MPEAGGGLWRGNWKRVKSQLHHTILIFPPAVVMSHCVVFWYLTKDMSNEIHELAAMLRLTTRHVVCLQQSAHNAASAVSQAKLEACARARRRAGCGPRFDEHNSRRWGGGVVTGTLSRANYHHTILIFARLVMLHCVIFWYLTKDMGHARTEIHELA